MNAGAVAELLKRHHRALTLAGVALLLMAAWSAASAYAVPVEDRHTTRTTAWTEETAFGYSVPVTRNSTHWPMGTILPAGEPAYFRTISDSILVNHTWAPTSSDPDARGIAAGRMSIDIQAQSPDGRTYWTISHSLDEATTSNATEGLLLEGRVDLDALVQEVARVHAEQPVVDGAINWTVRASIVYAFDAHGRRDQGETERILVIGASDPRFTLPQGDALRARSDHSHESVEVRTHPAGIPGILSSLRILIIGGAGLSLLVAGIALSRAPGTEPFDSELRRFREWVSTAGRIPEHSADPHATIDVRSLEDLIHVAADARTRVVLDERSRVFYAFLPGATYRYARHAF